MAQPQQSDSAPSPSSTANSLSQQLTQQTLLLSSLVGASGGYQRVSLLQSDRSLSLLFSHPKGRTSCLPFKASRKNPENKIEIEYRNILNCQLNQQEQENYELKLSYLKSSQDQNLKLKTLTLIGRIENENDTSTDTQKLTQNWVENLLLRSYEFKGVPRSRRVLIVINPTSGSQKSVKIWKSVVEPILKASTANYEVIFTTHAGHAGELGEKLDLDSVDVVSCVSGDGLVHEILNGLGRRESDFGTAMEKLALTSIPCGSGNALSTNHLGPKHAKNVQLATLNILKGTPIRLDLCSSTQLSDEVQEGQKEPESIRKLSLLSTSYGIMAELDVGTEHLRRLGPIRFVLGYLWGAIRNRQRKIRLDVQLVEKDKTEIERNFRLLRETIKQESSDPNRTPTLADDHQPAVEADSSGLPRLKYGDIRTKIDGSEDSNSTCPWTTIETDIVSFYAGILPFMSRELLLFPAKIPGRDGTIDITLQHSDSVWKSLACLIGAETGGLFKNPNCEFMKVKAFRLTFDSDEKNRSYVVLDGENLPYQSIQVEIHERAFQSLTLNSECPYFGSIGVADQIL
ncbi:sphinganine kinase lcb4 [Puccinia graminis f. sp. tritici]|uniref:Sphinganine kinase lcb4 n=1 Tax=Puccinia graminis f. sp. tritici TaxID=56615 RepID=A0A5B0PI76_PUCGR|nr:sphinganine kinase lcb4 [Puccinia graminis f. sp. tritici]KAA1120662.1 sphinganine kinase lcb4 [Puccinia graminis f. sp. tritici]